MDTFLKHIFTGPDNQTFEMTAFLTFLHVAWTMAAAAAGTCLYIYQNLHAGFDLKTFGIGLTVLGASVTAAIAALGYAKAKQYSAMTPPVSP